MSSLEALLKVGGIAALTAGIMYLLYRQIIALPFYSKMGPRLTFSVLITLGVLAWLLAVFALTDLKIGPLFARTLSIEGDCNQVVDRSDASSAELNC